MSAHRLLPAKNLLWRMVLPTAVVVLLLAHLAIAGGFAARNVEQVWFLRSQPPEVSELASFAEAHIPSRADVLYVTPTAQSKELWSYFLLSYALYPSHVWWVSPACVPTSLSWCIYSAATAEGLIGVASARGADYLILDDLIMPRLPTPSAEMPSDTRRSIIQLQAGNN